MRQKGWIKAGWRQTQNNQRARYYTITAAGRKQLGVEKSGFAEILAAIGRVMSTSDDRSNDHEWISPFNILNAEDAKGAQRHAELI